MKSRIPIHIISYLSILAIVLNIFGCAYTRVIQTNELGSNNDSKIIVYTKDGRSVKFMESDYKIDTSNVLRMINGDGIILKDSLGNVNKWFLGSISFSKIDSIEVTKFSPISSTIGLGIVIVGSAVMLLFFIGWMIGPISIG
jgi:hypothetical protein